MLPERLSETRDTVFFDLRTPEEKVMMALKMLLVRLDLAGIAFVLCVTEETVLAWLQRAAQKAKQINAHLLKSCPLPRCNSMRCGTSSAASTPRRLRTRKRAAKIVRTVASGFGSVMRRSFA